MKKFFIGLGIAFLTLIILAVVGIGIAAFNGSALDKESKTYVDEVTPIILADLNKDNLFKYADDQLKNSVSPEQFDKIFLMFKKLGKFKQYKESKGQSKIAINTGTGKVITGFYVAEVEFETGPAKIQVTTIKKKNSWKIIGFNINSMALANN